MAVKEFQLQRCILRVREILLKRENFQNLFVCVCLCGNLGAYKNVETTQLRITNLRNKINLVCNSIINDNCSSLRIFKPLNVLQCLILHNIFKNLAILYFWLNCMQLMGTKIPYSHKSIATKCPILLTVWTGISQWMIN